MCDRKPTKQFVLMASVLYPAVLGTVFYNLFGNVLSPILSPDVRFAWSVGATAPLLMTFAAIALFAGDYVRRFEEEDSIIPPEEYGWVPFCMDVLFLTGLALMAIWISPNDDSSPISFPVDVPFEAYAALAIAIAGLFLKDVGKAAEWTHAKNTGPKALQAVGLLLSVALAGVRGASLFSGGAVLVDIVAAVVLAMIGYAFLREVWTKQQGDAS